MLTHTSFDLNPSKPPSDESSDGSESTLNLLLSLSDAQGPKLARGELATRDDLFSSILVSKEEKNLSKVKRVYISNERESFAEDKSHDASGFTHIEPESEPRVELRQYVKSHTLNTSCKVQNRNFERKHMDLERYILNQTSTGEERLSIARNTLSKIVEKMKRKRIKRNAQCRRRKQSSMTRQQLEALIKDHSPLQGPWTQS